MPLVASHAQSLAQSLAKHVAGEVRFDDASRVLYSTDAGNYQVFPLGVVCPKTADDIAATVALCAEAGVPVTPRGAGSGLAGQAIGPGVVIDTSKFMDRLLDVDVASMTARVQPGLVLGVLNKKLAQHGLQFGPDPASAERCTVGGNIGTNATGAHSVRHGMTSDHVRAVACVLADGSQVELGPSARGDAEAAPNSAAQRLASAVSKIVAAHDAAIRRDFPKVWRRASGYNVDYIAEMLAYDPARPTACLTDASARRPSRERAPSAHGPSPSQSRDSNSNLAHHLRAIERFSLAPLIVGSEGTLACVTEATLNLVPKPKHTAIVAASFDSLVAAMEATPLFLSCDPSAIELLDDIVIQVARENPEYGRKMAWLSGNPQAVLAIEFDGASEAEARDGAERLVERAQRDGPPCSLVKLLDAKPQADLWAVRKAGQNLYYSIRSARKPISGVEDIAVPVEKLPDFVRGMQEIFAANNTEGYFYAHASAGVLHVRPMVNLKTADGVRAMGDIGRNAFALCQSLGGAMSGEHGDGYQRTAWNAQLFGADVYQVFCDIKAAFDPHNVLNPNKKVNARDPLESLRYGPDFRPTAIQTTFAFRKDGSFAAMLDQCNGNGDCRRTGAGVMCPSYRATREETHSTRGRANLLRAFMTQPRTSVASDTKPSESELMAALDLCLSCKACETECATQVDMAKLKSEFVQRHYDAHGVPMRARVLGRIAALNAFASRVAPLANALMKPAAFKRALGIAPQRTLPALARTSFETWWRRHTPRNADAETRAVLFVDTFARYNHPHVAIAAVELLERLGVGVIVPDWKCCGRPLISQGQPRAAQALARFNVAALAPFAKQGVSILGLEPSCISALKDDYADLVPGDDADAVAEATTSVEDFVVAQLPSSVVKNLPPLLVHGHCHQKATYGTRGTLQALTRAGYAVSEIESTCCGMAGAFGYEAEHYALSKTIGELALLPAVRAASDESVIVAAGASCREQIAHFTGREAKHPVELLASAVASQPV